MVQVDHLSTVLLELLDGIPMQLGHSGRLSPLLSVAVVGSDPPAQDVVLARKLTLEGSPFGHEHEE
jgi:hypothetical protein